MGSILVISLKMKIRMVHLFIFLFSTNSGKEDLSYWSKKFAKLEMVITVRIRSIIGDDFFWGFFTRKRIFLILQKILMAFVIFRTLLLVLIFLFDILSSYGINPNIQGWQWLEFSIVSYFTMLNIQWDLISFLLENLDLENLIT